MNKTISFVIPVYNEEKRILKTMTALINAAIPDLLKLEKIIFVNDGSDDNTLKVLKMYKNLLETATCSTVEIVSYGKKERVNIVFALFIFLLSLASFSSFFFYQATAAEQAAHWAKYPSASISNSPA